jgi:MFS family permease
VADLGLDRASFSLVIALSLFLYGVFMPLAGMALDRFSVRVVTSVGTVLLVALARADGDGAATTGSSAASTACWCRSGWPAPDR